MYHVGIVDDPGDKTIQRHSCIVNNLQPGTGSGATDQLAARCHYDNVRLSLSTVNTNDKLITGHRRSRPLGAYGPFMTTYMCCPSYDRLHSASCGSRGRWQGPARRGWVRPGEAGQGQFGQSQFGRCRGPPGGFETGRAGLLVLLRRKR